MKTTFVATLGLLLLIECHSSPPPNLNKQLAQNQNTTAVVKNAGNQATAVANDHLPQTVTTISTTHLQTTTTTTSEKRNTTTEIENAADRKDYATLASDNAVVINLEEIYKMSVLEYTGRRVKSLWHYLIHGSKEEPQGTFVGRCIGLAKKIRQLLPIAMIGGGVVVTKLAFLVLFSLKTMALVGLVLLLNVATIGAKLGSYLASKKSDDSPQNLHVHVQPWKNDDHISSHLYSSSSHHGGTPYGWDDRSDVDNIESHDLYNLYEKLKFENNFRRRYLSSTRKT